MVSDSALKTILVLHLAHLITCAPAPSCKHTEGVRLHLHLSSHVNATGHRVLAAQVESAGNSDQTVEMDVTQREANHNNEHVLALDTIASVLGDVRTSGEAVEKVTEQRVAQGAVPDGDFEEVRYADYRPLNSSATSGLYKVHREALTWTAARDACAAEFAHLLVPDTKAEAVGAAGFFMATPVAGNGARRGDLFFVGVSDADREGHYVTVTGQNLTSLAFNSWHSHEPSKGRDQNGVALDKEGNLHDIPNSWKLAFVCEAQNNT